MRRNNADCKFASTVEQSEATKMQCSVSPFAACFKETLLCHSFTVQGFLMASCGGTLELFSAFGASLCPMLLAISAIALP